MSTSKSMRLFLLLLMASLRGLAQDTSINNFIVKENLLKNYKIAIIAADPDEKPIDSVNGTFVFTVNGFRQDLVFTGGVAVVPQQIEKSAFIYIKHTNEDGTHSKLYYVLKRDESLNPYKISWLIILLIPLCLILLGFLFKRFIIIAAILLIVLFYFNHSSGLNLSRFFETIIDGLQGLF